MENYTKADILEWAVKHMTRLGLNGQGADVGLIAIRASRKLREIGEVVCADEIRQIAEENGYKPNILREEPHGNDR